MDRRFLLRVIGQNLKDIDEQFRVIRDHSDRIPQIELDIIKKNLQTVYEYFSRLEKSNLDQIPGEDIPLSPAREKPEVKPKQNMAPPAANTPPPPEKDEDKKAPEKEVTPIPKKDVSPDDVEPEKEQPTKKEEKAPGMPDKDISPDDAKPPENTKKEEPAPENGGGTPENDMNRPVKNTADLFSEGSNTLADKLKSKDEPRVADKIQKSPVKNLRSAIGINEKFLLLNELFSGKMKDYEDAIGKFEQCHSIEESSRVLNTYKEKFNWSSESEAYQTFDNLLRRKFL